jgi:hypothetical protein
MRQLTGEQKDFYICIPDFWGRFVFPGRQFGGLVQHRHLRDLTLIGRAPSEMAAECSSRTRLGHSAYLRIPERRGLATPLLWFEQHPAILPHLAGLN